MAVDPKTTTIRFGPLVPDAGLHDNPGLVSATHVVPQAEGYVFPTLFDDNSAEITRDVSITGAIAGAMGEYLYQIYVASPTKIYEVNSLDSTPPWAVNDVTQIAGTYTTVDSGVHFCQFGTHIIACMGADYGNTPSLIQWLGDTTSGGAGTGDGANLDPNIMWPAAGIHADAQKEFQDMIAAGSSTYEYKARFCAAADYRLIIAHLYDTGNGTGGAAGYLPNRVAWSKTDDPTEFHDATVSEGIALSDFQDLLDEWGPITGLSGGADYTLIFKARGIYRMTPGGPFQYSFQPVPNALGTRWSHSIVRLGNDVFFWGVNGPSVYLGGEHRVVELGLGKVSRSIRDATWVTNGISSLKVTGNTEEWLIKGVADPSNGLIIWSYPTSNNASSTTEAIAYNYSTGQFSFILTTNAGIDSSQYYMVSIPDSDRDYSVPRDVVGFMGTVGVANTIIKASVWDPDNTTNYDSASEFTTSFVALAPGQRSFVRRIRPLFTLNDGETTHAVITVNVKSREKMQGTDVTTTSTSSSDMDDMGWITMTGSPQREYHQFNFSIAASSRDKIAEFEGFEIEYSIGGYR